MQHFCFLTFYLKNIKICYILICFLPLHCKISKYAIFHAFSTFSFEKKSFLKYAIWTFHLKNIKRCDISIFLKFSFENIRICYTSIFFLSFHWKYQNMLSFFCFLLFFWKMSIYFSNIALEGNECFIRDGVRRKIRKCRKETMSDV